MRVGVILAALGLLCGSAGAAGTTSTTLPPTPTLPPVTAACVKKAGAAYKACGAAATCVTTYKAAIAGCFALGSGASCATSCTTKVVQCTATAQSSLASCQQGCATSSDPTCTTTCNGQKFLDTQLCKTNFTACLVKCPIVTTTTTTIPTTTTTSTSTSTSSSTSTTSTTSTSTSTTSTSSTTSTTRPAPPPFSPSTTACLKQATADQKACSTSATPAPICRSNYEAAYRSCFAPPAGVACALDCLTDRATCEDPAQKIQKACVGTCSNARSAATKLCQSTDTACVSAAQAAFTACKAACAQDAAPALQQCVTDFGACVWKCPNLSDGPCGNGVGDSGEECDDGNTVNGDCCSAGCKLEPAAAACPDDGNGCTDDRCDAQGTCQHVDNTASCDDGRFCTDGDTCEGGVCHGTPRDCSASGDQCTNGVCDDVAARCVKHPKTDGTPCDDGNGCTRSDGCQAGTCVGPNPVVCTAADQCHEAGACTPATGACSNPRKLGGTVCDDGNACTTSSACEAGVCTGFFPVVCTSSDQCHDGVCSPALGHCTDVIKPDGTPCDDGDPATPGDACVTGVCLGGALIDHDLDGVPDIRDICPDVFNPAQTDSNHDGVGDNCQCTDTAPGRCLTGGGTTSTDCFLELDPSGPVTLNAKGTAVLGVVSCLDGDRQCDQDGKVDGRCTFGVSFCLSNTDPRLALCSPADIISLEVISPSAAKGATLDQTNGLAIEQAVGALGIGIARGGKMIKPFVSSAGQDRCSPLVSLVVPAPTGKSIKPVAKTFQVRANAANKKNDLDFFTLQCGAASGSITTTTSTTLKSAKTTTTTTTLPPPPPFSDATTSCIAQLAAAQSVCTLPAAICELQYQAGFPGCFAPGQGVPCAATCENKDIACEIPKRLGCSACQNAWSNAGGRCQGDATCLADTLAAFVACKTNCTKLTIAQCRSAFYTCLTACQNR